MNYQAKSQSNDSQTNSYARPSQKGATKHQLSTASDSHKQQSMAKSVHQGQMHGGSSGKYQGHPEGGSGGGKGY